MARADLFSGSLAVWNVRGFAAIFARPPNPSRVKRGEEIQFEQFEEYTANQDFASGQRKPRGGFAAARLGFQKVFGAKTKRIYQERAKEIFN
ncbi:MAG: hypothetical protein HYW90_04895 [Candidatus Sungbacteria bacterium]|nr:hypothetical protein [Candidatus Sungbacteria bacterium]